MNARRILILLLMCLIPLYPVLAGAAVHQPASMHETAMSQSTVDNAAHGCCSTAQTDDHALNIGGSCDAGRCISHCAVSLTDVGVITPVQIAFIHTPPSITPLSSITLETPLRPPLTL